MVEEGQRPMRIVAISDLHVDRSEANAAAVAAVAEEVACLQPEVFIVAGDLSPAPQRIGEVLGAWAGLAPLCLFVPGNHDLWLLPEERKAGITSWEKYGQVLPEVCAREGFHYLPGRPVVWREVGFVGTMGWFDYSLRDRSLDRQIPWEAYERNRYRYIHWNDHRYARWEVSDQEVTLAMAEELEAGLKQLGPMGVQRMVAVTHHLPFEDLLPSEEKGPLAKRFCWGFLGSALLGKVLLGYPQVVHLFCGHLHLLREAQRNGLKMQTCSVGYLPSASLEEMRQRVRRALRVVEWPEPSLGKGDNHA